MQKTWSGDIALRLSDGEPDRLVRVIALLEDELTAPSRVVSGAELQQVSKTDLVVFNSLEELLSSYDNVDHTFYVTDPHDGLTIGPVNARQALEVQQIIPNVEREEKPQPNMTLPFDQWKMEEGSI